MFRHRSAASAGGLTIRFRHGGLSIGLDEASPNPSILRFRGRAAHCAGDTRFPKPWVFQTGTNEWHRFAAWPPKNAQRKAPYFTEKGGLSFTQPAAQSADEYVSDPAKPVPIRGNIEIEYVMPDICHTFRTGHRIMVQIQSTWFPMIDLNPQQFENIPTAKSSDFLKATERVYHGGADGSRLAVFTIGTDKD